jgi:putative serine protease PepD
VTTAYDPYGVPDQWREPLDPLLSLPDHPSGEWATMSPRSPRSVGHPRPARHYPTAYPVVADRAVPPRPGLRRFAVLALVLVLVLLSSWQAYRLERVGRDGDRLAAGLSAERTRNGQLTDRTSRLEKQLAAVFDPAAISSAVLPSVFRVRAGDVSGTAFAIGAKAADGQANLLTNFHVVESVWNAGNRKVFLERGRTELTATIVKVNRTRDLALLHATAKVRGLTADAAAVKPGQQVVVVGAPLGLEDTVTTGVVSAYRQQKNDGPTIQFDAPINPGNSGGPVVGSGNEVLGLATAKARDAEGIGLAIPIRTACDTFRNVC